MKKFYFLSCFFIVAISCTSDSTGEVAIDPNILQRVDFYPGTTFEKRYIFNVEGFLTEITTADGTLLEKFIYDAGNNVIQDAKFEDGSATENYNITYDLSNRITAINTAHYNYDAIDNRYYYTSGFYNYNCYLNSEFLITNSSSVFDDGSEDAYSIDYYCNYISGNMNSYSNYSPGSEIYTHYGFDNKVNPIKIALLPIFRIKSLIDPRFFEGSLSSVNNIIYQGYFSIDPESYTYEYVYNSNDLPVTQTRNDYYNGTYELSLVSAKYYYQGDTLP